MAVTETETPLESSIFSSRETKHPTSDGWGKWGILAAVSVVAGGLAAALWYKSAVKRLHLAEESEKNPDFRIHDAGEDI
jgi:hypothetical protein